MPRLNISSGSAMEAQMAYSRAVVLDEWIMLSGTTGYDYQTGKISNDLLDQAEQTLANISKTLAEANSSMADIVRIVYILPNRKDFPKVWPVLRKWLGDVLPASMMFEAPLFKDEMKIEMEVTAKKGCGAKPPSRPAEL